MSSQQDAEELSSLRAHLNRPLTSLLHRMSFFVPRSGNRHGVTRASGGPVGPGPVMPTQRVEPVENVGLKGDAVFLDDERRVRALAKEIKHLITEDKRRGIGI